LVATDATRGEESESDASLVAVLSASQHSISADCAASQLSSSDRWGEVKGTSSSSPANELVAPTPPYTTFTWLLRHARQQYIIVRLSIELVQIDPDGISVSIDMRVLVTVHNYNNAYIIQRCHCVQPVETLHPNAFVLTVIQVIAY
jgi:hypothetical protein